MLCAGTEAGQGVRDLSQYAQLEYLRNIALRARVRRSLGWPGHKPWRRYGHLRGGPTPCGRMESAILRIRYDLPASGGSWAAKRASSRILSGFIMNRR